MTQTVNQINSSRITFNPRLLELLENGNFDWDDEYHRTAYLKAWINQPWQEEDSLDGQSAHCRAHPGPTR